MSKKIDKDFKQQLESVLRDINYLDCYINAGGCGLFARQLANILIGMGYTVKYVLVCNDARGLQECRDNINNSDTNGLNSGGWRHVMLRVGGYYIDSTGVYRTFKDAQGLMYKKVTLPEKIFHEMLDPKHGITWNSMFNRRYMGVITRKLNQLKPKYDNYGLIEC